MDLNYQLQYSSKNNLNIIELQFNGKIIQCAIHPGKIVKSNYYAAIIKCDSYSYHSENFRYSYCYIYIYYGGIKRCVIPEHLHEFIDKTYFFGICLREENNYVILPHNGNMKKAQIMMYQSLNPIAPICINVGKFPIYNLFGVHPSGYNENCKYRPSKREYDSFDIEHQFIYFHSQFTMEYRREIFRVNRTIRRKLIILGAMFRCNTLKLRYSDALRYLSEYIIIKLFKL